MIKFPGKQALIKALYNFANTSGSTLKDVTYGHASYRPSRGETVLAAAFADWLQESPCPHEQEGLDWFKDLPELLHEAYDDFRTLPRWAEVRKDYDIAADRTIPSLVNIHEGQLDRLLVVMSVVHLMECLYCQVMEPYKQYFAEKMVTGTWLAQSLESYFGAQSQVIEQSWKRFVKTCYRPFMRRYKTDTHTGNSGKFGKTELLTFGTAGRLMFTFRRGDDQLTYVADDSDDFGNRAGPNSTDTRYEVCVSMIDEVVENWYLDKLKKSKGVGF